MINIEISGKNEINEQKSKDQLQRLMTQYDLKKYFFTKDIRIESFAQPHSHPVLTLNTRLITDDDGALSVFLHEQFHWYLGSKSEEVDQAIDRLKGKYPEVPVGGDEGARNEHSTYLHLVVNFLEFEELRKIIGEERAKKVIENPFGYKWIYKTVLEDNNQIREIMEENKLLLEDDKEEK